MLQSRFRSGQAEWTRGRKLCLVDFFVFLGRLPGLIVFRYSGPAKGLFSALSSRTS